MVSECMIMRKSKKTVIEAKQPPQANAEFMQLRSRRLYKLLAASVKLLRKRKLKAAVEEVVVVEEEDKEVNNVHQLVEQIAEVGIGGENLQQNTRDSTPERLIIRSEYIIATGSSTRASRDDVADHGPLAKGVYVPSAEHIESLFDASERKQEEHFTKKYNFNFKNQTPISGRYEWVKVEP